MFTRLEKASLGFLSSPTEECSSGELGNKNLKQEMEVMAPSSPCASKSTKNEVLSEIEAHDLDNKNVTGDEDNDEDGETELDSLTDEVISVYDQVSNLVINLKRSSVGVGASSKFNGRQSLPALGVSMLTDSSYSMSTQIKVRDGGILM